MENFRYRQNWKKCDCFSQIYMYLIFLFKNCAKMNFFQPQTGNNDSNMLQLGQGQLNQRYSVPVQNAFGPLGEWVGYSMGINGDVGIHESMDLQTAQSKRCRFSTGTDNTAFSSLSIDDKLSHMFEKLNNLEQTNKM